MNEVVAKPANANAIAQLADRIVRIEDKKIVG